MSTSDNSSKILDWALGVVSGSPPLQNVLAFLVILLLAMPLIRAGLREFKKPPRPPDPLTEVVSYVKMDAQWIYTQLINMQLQLGKIDEKLKALEQRRRRSRRRTKVPKGT